MDIRVVDFRAPDAAAEFTKSLKETGFGVLTNHSIDEVLIDEVYAEWREFMTTMRDESADLLKCSTQIPDAPRVALDTVEDQSTNASQASPRSPISADTTPKHVGTAAECGPMFSRETYFRARAELKAKCGNSEEIPPTLLDKYLRNPTVQDGFFPMKAAESAKGQTVRDMKQYYQCYFPHGRYPTEVSPRAKELYEQMLELGTVLLRWIDDNLDPALSKKLREKCGGGMSEQLSADRTMLRILHYPAYAKGEEEPGAIRAAAHEDINLITVLPAGSARGLQVQHKDTKEWYEVPCVRGSIIVNIGDMMQEMTNYEYIATTHRVVKPDDGADEGTDRMSVPCFIHPKAESYLSEKYPTADGFLMERLRELGVIKN